MHRQWYIVCRTDGEVPVPVGMLWSFDEELAIFRAVTENFAELHPLRLRQQLTAVAAGVGYLEARRQKMKLEAQAA